MAFHAGKTGRVTVGVANWKLNRWEADIRTDIVDTTNFESGGFKENIAGLQYASITASGPYDAGSMAMTSGTSYSFTLQIGTGITFTITARVASIRVGTEVADKGTVTVTAESTGTFTPSIT